MEDICVRAVEDILKYRAMAKKHRWLSGTCIKCGLMRKQKTRKYEQYYEYHDGIKTMLKRPDCGTAPKEKEITPDAIAEKAVAECLENYKKTGKIVDAGGAIYRYLWKSGKLRFGEVEWHEHINQAKFNLTEHLQFKLSNITSLIEKREIEKKIEEINGDDSTEAVKVEARKLALAVFFKNIL